MKLHEEFKLVENMWDETNVENITKNDSNLPTQYHLFLDGKVVYVSKVMALDKALSEITSYIKKLTPEQKDLFSLSWEIDESMYVSIPIYSDDDNYLGTEEVWQDCDGDVVVGVFSKSECEEYGYAFPDERFVINVDYAGDAIRKAFDINSTGDVLTESNAVVYFDQERQDDVNILLNKIKADHVTVEGSLRDFTVQLDEAEEGTVKFYTDAEGLKEIEDLFKNHPKHMKDRVLNKITLVDVALTEARSVADIEAEPNSQINEATAVTTYFVEVDSGHDITHIPNCTLDSAIENTRSELVDGRHGYRYITWTDEATGNVVFEYYSKTHRIETDIPAAKAELQDVVDAISGTLYAAISNIVYDTFTEAERQYLNTELNALKYKIKEIQLRRELDKFRSKN